MAGCTVCGGSKAEHYDEKGNKKTIHEYTEKQGDLHPESPKAPVSPPRQMQLHMQNTSVEVSRLVEVLMDKGLLTIPEVLYIAGVGPKPALPSGYRDPAQTGIMPCSTGGN